METIHGLHNAIDDDLLNWRGQQKDALRLIKIAGDLKYDRAVDLVIFRKDIFDARPSEIVAFHQVSETFGSQPLEMEQSLRIVYYLQGKEDLPPCKIDIGKLSMEYNDEGGDANLHDFIEDKLGDIFDKNPDYLTPKDIVLYGFGRIGRLLARRIIEQTGVGQQFRLRAIVLRAKMADPVQELKKRAALLEDDSIHGSFRGVIDVDAAGEHLLVNGNKIRVIFSGDPASIDYTSYGINDALLIDNTGIWRDDAGLSKHLRPGIEKIILTAPAKGVPNIVYGVNHKKEEYATEKLFSAASCTTNAIVPVIYAINQEMEIESGHIETIHAYTSDQNLLDNFHKKPRRGRAAAVNMVLTSTGAAKAVSKVMPEFEGKLTGNAVRVPTPDVSLAIISLSLNKAVTPQEINDLLLQHSLTGDLFEQIHFSNDTEFVSSHAIGTTTTSVVDGPSTIVSKDGKKVNIYAWYDNEYGYACQVVRLAKYLANVRRYTYY
ncbi:MAG TPA: glyceraldehyde-3-phosphate dehydrogenase [Saprospiraceae bacterium]|nr:glyceraldehyde-3-phosphate dehydrogenase [Saprospiraceae bacterium]